MAVVPEHIGPYRVLRPIAAGGMAEVYEVQDPASGERFALKLLATVQGALKRFNREYEAMTRLNHPGIVRVYHYGLHQGHPWLTMELLRGKPVQSWVKGFGRPGAEARVEEVLRVGYHVARALHYIHDRGLVHRDLKSANVLVLPDARVKLLDFGAAYLVDAFERITSEGEFVGTFAYAAPEQLRGKAIDHRADLYSLGVLLFRLLTGRRPFSSKDPHELARMHVKEPIPDPRTLVPDLDDRLVQLVIALLAKHPDERPATADLVARSLEELAGHPFGSRSQLAVHSAASAARETERRALWERIEGGPPADLVLVSGDEGSDRVRFLERAATEAEARGCVGYVCTLGSQRSLSRVIDALLEVAEDCDPEARRPLVARLREASTPEALANPRERAALRQTGAALARLRTRGGTRAILFLQEVHRAGPLALELLGGMRRALQGDEIPFKMVASARSADLDGASEVARRLGDGWRLDLEALGPRAVAVAVGTMLGRRPPPAELSRRLHRLTGGQPLYLEEAVRQIVDMGGIEADGNRLAWADQSMDLPLPERARRASDRVLETLPVAHRRVLEALVVADDATEPTVVARVLQWGVPETIAVIKELNQRGVLRWDLRGQATARWRQPLLATLVERSLHPCRRHVLKRALVRALVDHEPARGGVAAMLSQGLVVDAARAAVALARADLAQHRVRSALDVVGPVVRAAGDDVRQRAFGELFLLHSRCLRRVNPTDPSGMRSLARARAVAELAGDRLLLARIALAQARLNMVIGHYGNYARYLEQGWETAPPAAEGGASVRAALATELSRSFHWRGDLPKAEKWIETALEVAETCEDRVLVSHAVVVAASLMLARGSVDEAEQTLSQAMQDFERAGERPGFWVALARWANTLRLQGRFSEALSQLYQRLPEASQSQDATPYVELLLATAWIELDLSRLGRAQECTDELAATVHRGEHLHLRLESELLNGRIALESGLYHAAAWTLQEVYRSAKKAELLVLSEHARALWGETVHALGDREQGRTLFQSAILGLMGAGDVTALMDGVRGRARTEATERDPDRIFKPVQGLIDAQPVALTRLEQLLARGAWLRVRGERERAKQCMREAAMVLNRVATKLNDTDRAALRVHPWSGWIRRGLDA